jgi:prevent-host-death family protein
MAAALLPIEELPRRNATEVKNKWGDLVREVRQRGSVAVANHGKVEMVVVEVAKYRELAALAAEAEGRREASLAELAAEFDRHLAGLETPGTRERVDAALATKGRVTPRPKAGSAY